MKIISTWPRVSLSMFHQMALQDWSSQSISEEPLNYFHNIMNFIILALSHVLSTLLHFSLGNSVSVFSFDETYVLFDYFQVAWVLFVFSFFMKFFFPDISL